MKENVFWMDDVILDPFQLKKRKRIESIKNMLATLKNVDLNVFIANVVVHDGLNPITVRKYLQALETADFIEIKNGMVKWKMQK